MLKGGSQALIDVTQLQHGILALAFVWRPWTTDLTSVAPFIIWGYKDPPCHALESEKMKGHYARTVCTGVSITKRLNCQIPHTGAATSKMFT